MNVEIEVNTERIEEAIKDEVCSGLRDRLNEAIRGAIKSELSSALKDVVGESLRAEVDKLISEGWQQTNTWGEPQGEKQTLKALVTKHLTEDVGDYNRRMKRIEKVTYEAVDAALKNEFAGELKVARDLFRKHLDAGVAAKLRDAIASALGVNS
jgi:hypothetical protein